ncbi:MAG: hypothetical protein ABR980_02275 [Ignavibacteriaceae bacterium]|jgi:hypothetical protein
MTYLWQPERGIMIFRFQTDERNVADKMKRRKYFKLIGYSHNSNLWVFVAPFYSPQKARKSLERLTGRKAKKDSLEGVYCA